MIFRSAASLPILWAASTLLLAQSTDTPEAHFRASATLVQVDTTVSSGGLAVPDLTTADFVVYEDGKPQPIDSVTLQTNHTVAYLVDACYNESGHREDHVPMVIDQRGVPPLWGVPYIRPERIIAQFLDGLISHNPAPLDKIAILSDNEGSSKTEQPGADLGIMRANLARIPLPARLHGGCLDSGVSADRSLVAAIGLPPFELEGYPFRIRWDRRLLYQAISQAVDALSNLPGHKDLMVFSLFPLPGSKDHPGTPDPQVTQVDESLRRDLTEKANRSGIALHILASYEAPHPPDHPTSDSAGRLPSVFTTQNFVREFSDYKRTVADTEKITSLTKDTGGTFRELSDSRQGENPEMRVRELQLREPIDNFLPELHDAEMTFVNTVANSSIYLLTYRPGPGTGSYHKIDLKIRRPGVTARWRNGYYDTPPAPRPVTLPAAAELAEALEKPLSATSIGVRAMPFDRADEAPKGLRTIIDLVLSLDSRDLTWTPQPDGARKATLTTTAAWYRDDIEPAGTVTHDCTVTSPAGNPNPVAQCVLEIDPPSPGFYFIRAAVRDSVSGRLGAAYTLAPAPEYNRGSVYMSSPIVRRVGGTDGLSVDPVVTAGEELDYDLTAYSMELDKKTRDPKLTLRISLGNHVTYAPVSLGAEEVLNLKGPAWRVPLKGRFRLPPDIAPGDYDIQFLLTDVLAKDTQLGGPRRITRVAGIHVVSPDSTEPRN